MGETIRILLVDDHLMFRQGLRALLEDSPDFTVVGEAADGAEALSEARRIQPDIVLMDVEMPGCDGLEATRRLKLDMPRARVVMLTVHDNDPKLVYEAVKAGAMGYVSKMSPITDLVDSIRLVAQGQASISALSLTSLIAMISNGQSNGHSATPTLDRLSERELEVLALVAQGRSNREIAGALFVSESTVRSHVHNILDKLHLTNRVQAAAFALSSHISEPMQAPHTNGVAKPAGHGSLPRHR